MPFYLGILLFWLVFGLADSIIHYDYSRSVLMLIGVFADLALIDFGLSYRKQKV